MSRPPCWARRWPGKKSVSTGLSGSSAAPDIGCTCGFAANLGPPVRTGAHVGAQNAHACHIAHRNLTRAEWRDFLPQRSYRDVCP